MVLRQGCTRDGFEAGIYKGCTRDGFCSKDKQGKGFIAGINKGWDNQRILFEAGINKGYFLKQG